MTDDYNVAGLAPVHPANQAHPVVEANGVPIVDNRLHLSVDPKRIESWELMVMEDAQAKITDLLLVFCRYVADGSGVLSPEIVPKPIDELSARELAEIRGSKGFKALKRFRLPQLRDAAMSFASQARQGLDPN